MGLLNGIPALGGLLGKILDRVLPDKGESRAAQARVNEAEIAGAPPSFLRLWRSFLGWVAALVFAWEVIGRPIMATYWPGARLPPPMLEETLALLMSMLGLGF